MKWRIALSLICASICSPSWGAQENKVFISQVTTDSKPVTNNALSINGELNFYEELRQQIAKCWMLPESMKTSPVIATLHVWLSKTGDVIKIKAEEEDGAAFLLDRQYIATRDTAIEAVKKCAPYRLPAEKYEIWDEIIMTFDPREIK